MENDTNAITPQARLEFLRSELRRHDHLYYIEARPEISDRDYDALFAELRELEAAHPELATPDSPTARVAGAPLDSFTTVRHAIPMLSLDNTYNRLELQRFHEYVIKGLHGEQPVYTIEPKVDGVSIALRYENGVLVQALTRGNGKQGDDVTQNVRTIPSVPLRLRGDNPPAVFEARGEVFMSRRGFTLLNARRLAAGEEEFAHARNATAGSLKLLDSRIVANRPLDIVFYAQGVIDGCAIHSQRELFAIFREFGLKTQDWLRTAGDFDSILEAIAALEQDRRGFPYDTDRAVIKVDSFEQRAILGTTAHAPSWAKAYKFEPEQAVTRLEAITIQVGRTGVLTPVAELTPVPLAGSTISRATLHNEDDISRKDIRIGDQVVIEKAGEVIPAVVKALPEHRAPDSRPFDFLAALKGKCPSCGQPVRRDPKFAAWRCENLQCPAQNVRRVEYFSARNALDLEGLGGIVAEALVEQGLVNEPLDLYDLRQDQLAALNLGTEEEPRMFGAKNAAKLFAALERSRTMPLANWVQALGIPEVGAATAFQIGRTHRNLPHVAKSDILKAIIDFMAYQETGRLPDDAATSTTDELPDASLGELFSFAASQHAARPKPTTAADAAHCRQAWLDLLEPLELIKPSNARNRDGEYVTTSIGPKTAQAVLDFFASPTGQAILKRLDNLDIHPVGGLAAETSQEPSSGPLQGLVFVLTGTLQSMDRETASAKIRQAGGRTASSVSRHTDFLVAGTGTGARKTGKAAEYGVKVIDENQFLELLNGAPVSQENG